MRGRLRRRRPPPLPHELDAELRRPGRRRERSDLLDPNGDARQHRVGGVADRTIQCRSALRARDTRHSEYHEHENTKGYEGRETQSFADFAALAVFAVFES